MIGELLQMANDIVRIFWNNHLIVAAITHIQAIQTTSVIQQVWLGHFKLVLGHF